MVVSATEEVEGNWWLAQPQRTVEYSDSSVTVTMQVVLAGLRVHAPECQLTASGDAKRMTNVRLAVDTTFAQIDPDYPQLLMLRAGTDLIKELSREDKINLFELLRKGNVEC